jgi:RNA polymerase sigma-70 factor (ECF subfamily)
VQDGEEIIQEVFLALFKHLQNGKRDENLRGWVFRVAHNLALKQRQALKQRSARCVQDVSGTQDPAAADCRVDPGPSPEEHAAHSQRHNRLRAVLHALPEQDQRCLALRAEGLRYRDIAEVLGISLGSVSNSLARSLARLGRADER